MFTLLFYGIATVTIIVVGKKVYNKYFKNLGKDIKQRLLTSKPVKRLGGRK